MRRLDDWVLEERIGSGGLAEVWRAHREGDDREVAIKVLREPDRSRSHRARFLREGRLLGYLRHPGLPRCEGVSDGEQPYIVLELLHGETLSHRIKRAGPLPVEAVERLALRILDVLDYLHQKGIIHRDIKASNIYLEADGRVLLLDLGLAADAREPLTTTLGDVMGTYAYMAPEQIAGAYVDHRSDLYSLGITLYEALAGTRPYQTHGSAGYLRAHREGRATPLRELVPEAPERILDAIARLMARDPAARPISAAIARVLFTGHARRVAELRPPPLVGRSAAVGAIHGVLDEPGVLLLLGELGSGQGRMARFALDLARRRHMEVIAIRCRGRGSPLDPIEQLARDLGHLLDAPVLPRFPSLARALDALAGEGPALLLVEDVEHAGADATRILGRLFRARTGLSVVITGTTRPEGIDAHVVRLRQLRLEETYELVRGMLGTHTPPANLAEELHRMSGGQPAIVVLAIRELAARDALTCEGIDADGRLSWRLDRAARIEPTAGLSRLFGQVLEALPAPSRRLLEVLAVAGEPLPLRLALEVAECDPSGIDLGPLARSGIVGQEHHEDGEWAFLRRPAVGTIVLDRLAAGHRTDIHARLAAALEAEAPGSWRDARLAWHRAHAAPPGRAPAALLALGDELLARGQHARALDVFDKASRIPGAPTRVAAGLALSRGEALVAVGRRDEAIPALAAGRRLAEDLGETSLVARGTVNQARLHQDAGDDRQATLLAEEALDLLRDRPDDPSLPPALLLAARGHHRSARPEQAVRLYTRCAEVARAQGRREYAALAQGGLGAIFLEEGHLAQAMRHFEQESSQLRGLGLPQHLVPSQFGLAMARLRAGQPDEADRALEEAADAARFADIPYLGGVVATGRAAVALAMGDWEEAHRRLGEGRVALDPVSAAWARMQYRLVQAEARLASGDLQAALAVFQAGEGEARQAGYAAMSAWFLGMAGVLTADPDAITEAMDVLSIAGDRRLAARLLLFGATVGGDAEVLASAERETRASGDRFLLLEVLHASGTRAHQAEAADVVRAMLTHVPLRWRDDFLALPAVRWTGVGRGFTGASR